MPFKKRNNEYYFEKKELLSREYLPKEHKAQWLALCQMHAAMYQEFIKYNDRNCMMDDIKKNILHSSNDEIPISLGKKKTSIHFHKKHISDLKIILQHC